jgi:YidC/Oxa1 family membrane protein insertase
MIPLANVLQPLIDVFESILKFFAETVGLSWGLSIIALTIVVRAALVPLTLKQFKSMQALQRLSPEIKALQEKYKDDKQRQQQEMMKFYQENKVNPFSSCLPLVLQMPVFISLFYMLRKDLRHDICPAINPPSVANPKPCGSTDASQFFFIPDITDKATGAVLVTLLVLYVGSQLISSIFMSVTADRNQRMIMIALPFVFVPFIQGFPAGLIVYWITTNLWTVGQGYIIRRRMPPPVPRTAGGPATAGARAVAPDRPVSRWRRPAADSANGADGASAGKGSDGAPAARPRRETAPPPPPRKKKKRSGRRR